MKKKMVCLLLVLCTVMALLPVLAAPAMAAENEGGGEDASSLYVQDGLIMWFDAFDNTAANTNLDLAAGKWKSKVGNAEITIRGSENYPWKAMPGGGFGWVQDGTVSEAIQSNGLYFDTALIPEGSYTVELVAAQNGMTNPDGTRYVDNYDSVNNKGNIYGIHTGETFAVGAFRSMSWCSMHAENGKISIGGSLGHRWYFTGRKYGDHFSGIHNDGGVGMTLHFGEHVAAGFAANDPYNMAICLDRVSDTEAMAKVLYNGAPAVNVEITPDELKATDGKLIANNAGYNPSPATPVAENVKFQLMVGLAGTVYAVRVYNRALTEEEISRNAFADLANYYGLDLTNYSKLSDKLKAECRTQAVGMGYHSDKAAIEKMFLDVATKAEEDAKKQEALENEVKNRANYDEFYVKDGLQIWLDAFVSVDGYNDTIDLAAGKWTSKIANDKGEKVVATLGGAGDYWKSYGYGIGYSMTLDQYRASLVNGICKAGVFFDVKELPEDNWTVDMVWNAVGLTNPDGTRYCNPEDSTEIWGIYTGAYSAFSFGPFKAMAFICDSKAENAKTVGYTLRWCYTAKEWNQHNGSAGYTVEFSFRDTMEENPGLYPVSYIIRKQQVNASSILFATYYNMQDAFGMGTPPVRDDEPEFELMHGFPGTVYAIRVYDRVLKGWERSQNHAADLMNFYGIDPAFYAMVLEGLDEESRKGFYMLFDSMDFSMSKEDASLAFSNILAGAFMESLGLAGRVSDKAGVRAEFRLNLAAMAALAAKGYKLEAGILLNQNGVLPTVGSAQTRVVLRDVSGNINGAYVIRQDGNEARVALAVLFTNPTPAMSATPLSFRGYLVLTDSQGEQTTLYCEVGSENYINNLCSLYRYLSREEKYASNKFMTNVVEQSYEYTTIQVDAEEGNDAANGKDAPVKTLARAVEALMALLNADTMVPQDVTIELAAGQHFVGQTLELDNAKIQSDLYRIHFKGAGESKSVITSNIDLAGADFEKVVGKEYYSYQLEKDAEGKYPDFRVLFVDGKIADIAHAGYIRTYDAEQATGKPAVQAMLRNQYELFMQEDGKTEAGAYKLYLPKTLFENLTEEDFSTLEYHMPIAWYYRMMHVPSVDMNDTTSDGSHVAACFVPEEVENWSAMHGSKGHYYWLANTLTYLDEPGEYFYNKETGTLYYYPAADVDMTNAKISYPTQDYLMAFLGVQNVSFENLSVTGTDTTAFDAGQMYDGGQATTAHGAYGSDTLSAIYMKDAADFRFYRCTFSGLGASALKAAGTARNLTVETCTFKEIGSSAIDFSNRNGRWDEKNNAMTNLLITDNNMDNIAVLTRGSVAVLVGVAKELEISYNTIRNTSYTAISVGWRWTEVGWEFGTDWHLYHVNIYANYFESFMTDQSDGGAIYTLGGNVNNGYTDLFNQMHENFVLYTEQTWDGQGMVMPYYHDGASSNWHTYSNVQILHPERKVQHKIYLQRITDQRTHNILVEDNVIVGAYRTVEQRLHDIQPTEYEYLKWVFGVDPFVEKQMFDGVMQYPLSTDETRNLVQINTRILEYPSDLDATAEAMVASCGSSLYDWDVDEVIQHYYDLYDAFYTRQEAEYLKQN